MKSFFECEISRDCNKVAGVLGHLPHFHDDLSWVGYGRTDQLTCTLVIPKLARSLAMNIKCPACSHVLSIPDTAAGEVVSCPCGSQLRAPGKPVAAAPGAHPAMPEPGQRTARAAAAGRPAGGFDTNPFGPLTDPDLQPAQSAGGGKLLQPYAPPSSAGGFVADGSAGLRMVGAGLLVQGWAIAGILMVVAMMVVFAMTAIGAGVLVGGLLLLVVIIPAAIAMFVGEFMCLAAPVESGAKGLIVATVFCSILWIGSGIADGVLGEHIAIAIIGGLTGLGRIVLFLLFLRAIALHAGFHHHATRALTILIGMPTCLVLLIGAGFVLPLAAGAGAGAGVAGILGLLVLGCGLAALCFGVMYVFLLFRLGSGFRR